MKKLRIESEAFQYMEQGFKEWLDILGYSSSALTNFPIYLREFFHYMETQKQIGRIQEIGGDQIKDYLYYLMQRPLENRGGALSSSSLNHHFLALKLLSKYLYVTGKYSLSVNLMRLSKDATNRYILTTKEIHSLYEASYETNRAAGREFGQRDRAMLTLLYGCGLRKNEAIQLNVADLNRESKVLHVRKGKGGKERLVPVTPKNMDYLTRWLDDGRYWFLDSHAQSYYKAKPRRKAKADDQAFLIGNRGQRLSTGYYPRLTQLLKRSGIDKQVSLHTLRHSIATHLLEAGMEIEDIATFLGHSSLESTQIYTHIINHKP